MTPIEREQADTRARRIASALMSPFCPGKTLDACPSPRAQAFRQDIRTWVAAGVSTPEIHARLQSRVPGFDYSGRPGVGWDWALPVGAILLMSVWLLWLWRRIRPRSGTQAIDDAPKAPQSARDAANDAALDDRLDRELREF